MKPLFAVYPHCNPTLQFPVCSLILQHPQQSLGILSSLSTWTLELFTLVGFGFFHTRCLVWRWGDSSSSCVKRKRKEILLLLPIVVIVKAVLLLHNQFCFLNPLKVAKYAQ